MPSQQVGGVTVEEEPILICGIIMGNIQNLKLKRPSGMLFYYQKDSLTEAEAPAQLEL